jgi:hypothetical protein
MSPTAAKHKPTKHAKSRVPIVNVFDEEEPKQESLQPARHPVVVEIEDAAPEAPLQSPVEPALDTPMAAPSVPQSAVQPVTQYQPPEPVAAPQTFSPQPATSEPALPSFFAQDLQSNVAPVTPGQMDTPLNTIESTMPQAVVGEINQEASGGGGKKILGIVLVIVALIVLAVGGLILYAKNLFAPVPLPTPTPTTAATPSVTPSTGPTPVASGSATASQSAELKKKVKVDVLNGTTTAGLAAKQAAVLKAAGFTTGTVGNGTPANAGTIVVAPANKALATEITTLLKEFTFTITESAKATTIQVTLGEPK